nr:stimulated by retinoic acid gene 6 protein-like [Anolis sagrei ordinatus]
MRHAPKGLVKGGVGQEAASSAAAKAAGKAACLGVASADSPPLQAPPRFFSRREKALFGKQEGPSFSPTRERGVGVPSWVEIAERIRSGKRGEPNWRVNSLGKEKDKERKPGDANARLWGFLALHQGNEGSPTRCSSESPPSWRPARAMDNETSQGFEYYEDSDDNSNSTCNDLLEIEYFIRFSLIPSAFIILVLSCLETRVRRCCFDEKCPTLSGFIGVVTPLDRNVYSNRWSLGCAFGVTANKVMFLFDKDYIPDFLPNWAVVFWVILTAIEVGVAMYPFFACLSSRYPIVGAVLGFLYTVAWLVITIVDITRCPEEDTVGGYNNIIILWPSLVCYVLLLGKFIFILVKDVRDLLGLESVREDNFLLEDHQAQCVQLLLRKPPLQQLQKSWIKSRLYEWDSNFKFPSRMISTSVLVVICLYMVMELHRVILSARKQLLSISVAKQENISTSAFAFKIFRLIVAVSYVLQVATYEYIFVAWVIRTFSPVLDGFAASIFADGSPKTKEIYSAIQEFGSVLKGVWQFSLITSSFTCFIYVAHLLVCYRTQIRLLRAGKKSLFLSDDFKVSPPHSVVSSGKFTSWQVAYILWGFSVMQLVIMVFGMVIMYIIILPMKHGQWKQLLDKWGTVILSLAIVMFIKKMQVYLAGIFFLQPKLSPKDKQKPLALDNRLVSGTKSLPVIHFLE